MATSYIVNLKEAEPIIKEQIEKHKLGINLVNGMDFSSDKQNIDNPKVKEIMKTILKNMSKESVFESNNMDSASRLYSDSLNIINTDIKKFINDIDELIELGAEKNDDLNSMALSLVTKEYITPAYRMQTSSFYIPPMEGEYFFELPSFKGELKTVSFSASEYSLGDIWTLNVNFTQPLKDIRVKRYSEDKILNNLIIKETDTVKIKYVNVSGTDKTIYYTY